jgi:DNA replication protein DnaC
MYDFLDRIQVQKEPGPEQYLGADGLIYCGKCHTPVQCRITFEGKERIMPCICKCQKEERERQKQRMKEEEQLLYVRRLKAAGIQERHLQDWTFASAMDTPSVQMAKRYVENWKKVKAENLGLLLWGDVGTGKSFLAACIANALLEKGVPVLMTNFSKILNQMGAMYSDERYRYIASFNRFSLLIIDDLGIERNTEYALEQVYAVVDERYKAGLPLIITTNLTISQLRNPEDVAHARIYSRVLEMCTPVHVPGLDRRTVIGKSKQELVKEVLFS